MSAFSRVFNVDCVCMLKSMRTPQLSAREDSSGQVAIIVPVEWNHVINFHLRKLAIIYLQDFLLATYFP